MPDSMQVTILLFALAREKAGRPTLTLTIPDPARVSDLKDALAQACPSLAPLLRTMRIAINSEYALDDDQAIPTGSELAAIPPVSGGSPSSPHRP